MCIYVKSWYHANEMKSVDEQLLAHTPNDMTPREIKRKLVPCLFDYLYQKNKLCDGYKQTKLQKQKSEVGALKQRLIYIQFLYFSFFSQFFFFFLFANLNKCLLP